MTLTEYLAEQQRLIDGALDRWVPPETEPPESIHKAMRYSLFAGGKRIRPVLAMAAAQAVSDSPDGIENAACTLELIHTYSLIHDDLPAMDNDDLRRGRPTNHKVFGEAMAILAGDALLTLAFEVLAQMPRDQRLPQGAAGRQNSHAHRARLGGMIAGQVFDIEGRIAAARPRICSSGFTAPKPERLLRASVRIGAIYAGASEEQLQALTKYGEHVGLAFQIVDDLLDVEQSSEDLGKTAGKDAQQHKITFPAVYGIARSHEMAEEQRLAAHLALQPLRRAGGAFARDSPTWWFTGKHERERAQAGQAESGSTAGGARAGRVARAGAGADHCRVCDRERAEGAEARAELFRRMRASKLPTGSATWAAAV